MAKISDIIIIELQAVAAILMGLDYVSVNLKEQVENKIKPKLATINDDYKKALDEQIAIIWSNIGYLWLFIYFTLAAIILWLSVKMLKAPGFNLIILAIALISIIFSIYLALMALSKFLEKVIPAAIPAFFRLTISYMLSCQKGVLGAFGFIILMASFICRLYNALIS